MEEKDFYKNAPDAVFSLSSVIFYVSCNIRLLINESSNLTPSLVSEFIQSIFKFYKNLPNSIRKKLLESKEKIGKPLERELVENLLISDFTQIRKLLSDTILIINGKNFSRVSDPVVSDLFDQLIEVLDIENLSESERSTFKHCLMELVKDINSNEIQLNEQSQQRESIFDLNRPTPERIIFIYTTALNFMQSIIQDEIEIGKSVLEKLKIKLLDQNIINSN